MVQTGSFVDEGIHPCNLSDGVARFGDGRWDIYLVGLGLRRGGMGLFSKPGLPFPSSSGFGFWGWRATGLWVSRGPR